MQNLSVTEYEGIRVLTSKQLAEAYGTTPDVIGYNYRYNKERYKEGKHYIMIEKQALREYKITNVEIQRSLPKISKLYLWTEKGALLHAKSLNTDKAWEVYDYLVDFYFRVKNEVVLAEKSEPEKRKSGRAVVDVPENADMQKAIQDVRKYLNALDVIMIEYNVYRCEENFQNLKRNLDIIWLGLGRKIVDLMGMEPQVIIKEGY
ncbi:hypothetical protein C817_03462 [Dorea sp. 5-2]|nr:hypothetical protein C817_03462 [Dorea sp. 5-2]